MYTAFVAHAWRDACILHMLTLCWCQALASHVTMCVSVGVRYFR